MSTTTDPSSPSGADPLRAAIGAVLRPLARLAIAKGIPARELEDLLRIALVAAAQETQPAEAAARQVSRIATATGLTRREVTRLVGSVAPVAPARRSPATELFARWLATPALRDADGKPLPLPRQGPAPSFEALAQSVTRDVHPRSLLESLCRLGLAEVDEAQGKVRLLQDRFVPGADDERLWSLLGSNVGDHLAAAVGNVLGSTPRQVEQAVFADGLSEPSLEQVRTLARDQWQTLLKAVVPAIQQLIEADRDAGRAGTHRVRLGLYSFSASTGPASPEPASAARRRKATAAPPPPRPPESPDTGAPDEN